MNRAVLSAILAGAFVLTLAACDDKTGERPGSGTSAIDTATLAPGGTKPTAPDTTALADSVNRGPVATHLAVISTTMGDIEIELYGNDVPKTVKNFVELAKKKYYDSIAFHRVIPNYMIQTGDPNSKDSTQRSTWGQGGESIYGDTFEDELDSTLAIAKRGYAEGVVAMANSGPNTNGSQFFIVASTPGAAHLPYNYTIFGFVRKGMDVVHKIEQTGVNGEMPERPAKIKTITVREAPPAVRATDTTTASR